MPPRAMLGGVLAQRALNNYSELVVGGFIAGHGQRRGNDWLQSSGFPQVRLR
ncbi:MAG: hypothetical protein WA990_15910 [Rubrobacteraceae bacterium]